MKILFYLHRYPAIGGIESVTTFLANAFVEMGHEVRIFSHFGVTDRADGLNGAVEVARIDQGRVLRQEVETWKPNLIIYQDSYAPIEKMMFYPGMSVPVIVCEHNSPFYCYTEPNVSGRVVHDLVERIAFPVVKQLKYLRDRLRRRYLYERCWRYVLLSDRFLGEFRAVARVSDARKLRAIPNAVQPVVSCVKEKRNEILFVGAINRRKGCDRLVEIWYQLSPMFADWELTIVGDGPLRNDLEEEIRRKNIQRINFEGWRNDPAEYFARAKIFCLPSKREGWGLVLLEAQSHGCVPVAFDSYSSIRDIITSGRNGLLVPAFEEPAMIRALEALMQDRETLSKMSAAGRVSAKNYSPDIIVKNWQNMFDELVDANYGEKR